MSADKLAQALQRIADWNECSAEYRMDNGSNGERDYYRRLAREALAAHQAQQAEPAGKSQHDADSVELRSLCQARDAARRERDGLRAELAGAESASGHLSALVDDLRGLLAESMRVMKALHESAAPDDGPEMSAIIPAGAFRQFVDDNAKLMHLIHISPHELPVCDSVQVDGSGKFPSQQAQAPGWQLVPVEPTPEMLEAAKACSPTSPLKAAWARMLAAAPQQGGKTAADSCVAGLRNVIAADTKEGVSK
jgi:hypothetical protein